MIKSWFFYVKSFKLNFYDLDEEQYICSLCDPAENPENPEKPSIVTFNQRSDYILHLMSSHPTIKYDNLKPKKLNECHLCGKSFSGHSSLLRHINYHTREKQVGIILEHFLEYF